MGENGIDDLYKVSRTDVDYVIIEYKFVGNPKDKGSWKLDDTNDGKQGSQGWVLGSDRLQRSVGDEHAIAVEDAMKSGRVEMHVVTVHPDGSTKVEVLGPLGKPIPIATSKIIDPDLNLSGAQP